MGVSSSQKKKKEIHRQFNFQNGLLRCIVLFVYRTEIDTKSFNNKKVPQLLFIVWLYIYTMPRCVVSCHIVLYRIASYRIVSYRVIEGTVPAISGAEIFLVQKKNRKTAHKKIERISTYFFVR